MSPWRHPLAYYLGLGTSHQHFRTDQNPIWIGNNEMACLAATRLHVSGFSLVAAIAHGLDPASMADGGSSLFLMDGIN